MWYLAKGYIERRNAYKVTILILEKIYEIYLNDHFSVPEWT